MTKIIARLLLLMMILCSAVAMSGCYFYPFTAWRAFTPYFEVVIQEVSQADTIEFEIATTYYMVVHIFGDVDVNDETYKDIQIEYNDENMVISHAYAMPRSNAVYFNIYSYDLSSDNTLKITYGGRTVEAQYRVIDYDFESANWITPTSIDDLNAFPEFKEMLLSIKRHEFKGPYKGLESYSYSPYWDDGYWYYDLADKNDTGYLEYLTDSVYYPSTMDLVEQNPVARRDAYMSFTGRENVQAGASRSVMDYFSVSYSVIDPGCTKPQYPLHSLYFSAQKKEDWKYPMIKEGDYPAPISVLLEKYPERFFEYDLNGLKIYIRILGDSGASAYFSDENYVYAVGASYDYD